MTWAGLRPLVTAHLSRRGFVSVIDEVVPSTVMGRRLGQAEASLVRSVPPARLVSAGQQVGGRHHHGGRSSCAAIAEAAGNPLRPSAVGAMLRVAGSEKGGAS